MPGYIMTQFVIGIIPALLLLLALFSFMSLAEELEDVGKGGFTLADALMVVFLTTPKRIVELLPVSTLLREAGFAYRNSEVWSRSSLAIRCAPSRDACRSSGPTTNWPRAGSASARQWWPRVSPPRRRRSDELLTDGEVSNTDAVISLVSRNAAHARVFTFGIAQGGCGGAHVAQGQTALERQLRCIAAGQRLPSQDHGLRIFAQVPVQRGQVAQSVDRENLVAHLTKEGECSFKRFVGSGVIATVSHCQAGFAETQGFQPGIACLPAQGHPFLSSGPCTGIVAEPAMDVGLTPAEVRCGERVIHQVG